MKAMVAWSPTTLALVAANELASGESPCLETFENLRKAERRYASASFAGRRFAGPGAYELAVDTFSATDRDALAKAEAKRARKRAVKSVVLSSAQSRALYELAEPGIQPSRHTGNQLCELGLASYSSPKETFHGLFKLTSAGWAELGIKPDRKAF